MRRHVSISNARISSEHQERKDYRTDPTFSHFARHTGDHHAMIGNWHHADCPCGWKVRDKSPDVVRAAAKSHNDWYERAIR